jgi:hypothetical protein
MVDPVLHAFLERQHADAAALCRDSDLVAIAPHGTRVNRFLVQYSCTGLVQAPSGAIVEASNFFVGITFPPDYLRRAEPFHVVTWLGPPAIWHPNVAPGGAAICVGRLSPGTSLVDLVYQCWEIVTWNKVTMREDDALNSAACEWARHHPERFPVDRRPLKRPRPSMAAGKPPVESSQPELSPCRERSAIELRERAAREANRDAHAK